MIRYKGAHAGNVSARRASNIFERLHSCDLTPIRILHEEKADKYITQGTVIPTMTSHWAILETFAIYQRLRATVHGTHRQFKPRILGTKSNGKLPICTRGKDSNVLPRLDNPFGESESLRISRMAGMKEWNEASRLHELSKGRSRVRENLEGSQN